MSDKILAFFGAFLACMGAISSVAVLLASNDYILAVGAVVLAYAAFPKVKEWVKRLI